MSRARRSWPLVVALALALSACGDASVSASTVEDEAQAQFSQQFPVESVECPEDLAAEIGATTTCVLVSEGQAFEMLAEVTAVDGDDVELAFELTAEL